MRKRPLAFDVRNCARERGNAVIEFVAVIALLLLPAIIAATALSTLFSAKNAAASAARNAARVYVRSESSPTGRTRATAIARLAFADRGIAAEPRISFQCTRNPCLSPGGYVDVTMSADIALPLIDIPVTVAETRRFPVDVLRRARQ
jgi:TadE-like protein.